MLFLPDEVVEAERIAALDGENWLCASARPGSGISGVSTCSPRAFVWWHEAFLNIVGNQAAIAIERMVEREDDDDAEVVPARPSITDTRRSHAFRFYKGEDCIFVDGEYLIRNVPARLLWKILRSFTDEGRTEFTNRELRLDPWLELPAVKDNLESRLILARERRADDRLIVSAMRPRPSASASSPSRRSSENPKSCLSALTRRGARRFAPHSAPHPCAGCRPRRTGSARLRPRGRCGSGPRRRGRCPTRARAADACPACTDPP
jgi:hypothetical protein